MTVTLFYALAFAADLAPEVAYALLAHFGSAQAIFAATPAQLCTVQPTLTLEQAQRLLSAPVDEYAASIQALSQQGYHTFYPYKDPYPHNLRKFTHPPLVLFARGKPIAMDIQSVAILGSSQVPPATLELAKQLGAGLADRGLTVVTSLNRGVDITALRAALDIGGRAFGVLNHGLLAPPYPAEHADVWPELAWQGALLSPFAPNEPASAPNNPLRDAVILGLSRAVILLDIDPNHPRSVLPTLADETQRLYLTPADFDPTDLDSLAETILSHSI